MPATVEEGVEFPRCWCGDLCKAKTADDPFSYTKGRRFFMCANYAHDPAPQRNVLLRPSVRITSGSTMSSQRGRNMTLRRRRR
ncbi:hypothetical protein BRADI_4g17952v3 [Brachypodium distachyon]|uniref:Uncharacterized protein n=1 Tax=Brachypodium distachyon TaxID=15368 RepID=A0A0Q3L765_BRADI|nr:hypothetical protein BRADI_4g17952v3 [Brachypodium distachyon]